MAINYIWNRMYLFSNKRKEKRMDMEILKIIKIGDWAEALIYTITLGFGSRISKWIAIDLLGYKSCYCCERKQWSSYKCRDEV